MKLSRRVRLNIIYRRSKKRPNNEIKIRTYTKCLLLQSLILRCRP